MVSDSSRLLDRRFRRNHRVTGPMPADPLHVGCGQYGHGRELHQLVGLPGRHFPPRCFQLIFRLRPFNHAVTCAVAVECTLVAKAANKRYFHVGCPVCSYALDLRVMQRLTRRLAHVPLELFGLYFYQLQATASI